ncbi:N-acetylneuraminate synthase [Campylobacter suis]|uniref:N,N'-diacetyllegionaminic acid synthase n=1 Tax=Campylobacter suis TaxID=2790657 RepID=A0ABN7K868_9BACT|nr:N-acetylneuraminate synthase [Campylobacter suis]CAD7288714.1 N,N'-diacetyllegionaminic acid synthase [Campylobacter suis]
MGVFIIAEAGVNHNGDINLAKKLIDVAASSGANAVKFQTFKAELSISKNAQKAEYQKQTTDQNETQFEMIKRLELDIAAHKELMAHCAKKGIKFLSTPFDLASVKILDELGLDIFKIPSGEIVNLPYLKAIAKLDKRIILSSGMANLGEIECAIDVLINNGTKRENITVLHANTEYPTPFEDVNLKAMQTIANAFGVKVGYSDHTLGIEVPIAAVAMGASMIEKHFTLDKAMQGPDHKASLEPDELCAMVSAIRNIELALGDGIKKASKSESKNISIARKSIVAAHDIKKGEIFSEKNLAVKRPAGGISPMRWDEIVGRISQKDYTADEMIVL